MKQALFRVGAGGAVGGGHAMRCLALADELSARGWTCTFAAPADLRTIPAFRDKPDIRTVHLPADETAESSSIAKLFPDGCDLLVVDDYNLDEVYERACRSWAATIAVVEDMNMRRHDCDVLINSSPGWTAADYQDRLPGHSRLLMGPRYATISKSVRRARARPRNPHRPHVNRILVGMGLTDPFNATTFVLEALKDILPDVHVDVLISSASPHVTTIRRHLARWRRRGHLHLDARDPASIMARADLAIGAAGSMSWERSCLGLASIVLILADNQQKIAEALAAHGAGVIVGRFGAVSRAAMTDTIADLANAPHRRHRMSQLASILCDGCGAARVVDSLIAA